MSLHASVSPAIQKENSNGRVNATKYILEYLQDFLTPAMTFHGSDDKTETQKSKFKDTKPSCGSRQSKKHAKLF